MHNSSKKYDLKGMASSESQLDEVSENSEILSICKDTDSWTK